MADSKNVQQPIIFYGGDFIDWKQRLTALLRSHQLDHCLQASLKEAQENLSCQARDAAALSMMKTFVDPTVLQHMPLQQHGGACALLRALQDCSKPFPFLDLPPEVRNRIYEYLLPAGKEITVYGKSIDRRAKQPSSPRSSWVIVGVCRLIRKEGIGLFYSRYHFILRGPVGIPDGGSVALIANRWAGMMPSDQIRNLTKVTLQLLLKWRSIRTTTNITFMLSQASELRIECKTSLTQESRKRLAAHTKKVETTRRLLNFQGEAIILALKMDGNLWSFGELNIA